MTASELHRKAMMFFDLAENHKFNGETDRANDNYKKALTLEKEAAFMAKSENIGEPTISILFRSAACMALRLNNIKEAQELASTGLSESTPAEIARELNEIKGKPTPGKEDQISDTTLTKPVRIYQSLSAELFGRFKGGDVDALKYVHELYFSDLYDFIIGRVQDDTAANDIAIDSLFKLLKYRNSVEDADHLRGYLFHIAWTGCVDYFRKRNVTRTVEMEYLGAMTDYESYLQEQDLRNQLLSDIERQSEIDRHIGSLPERYQDVLRLLYKEGQRSEEVAANLNLSVNQVYVIHSRALAALRKLVLPPDALGILLFAHFLLYPENQCVGISHEKGKIFFQKGERIERPIRPSIQETFIKHFSYVAPI